MQFAVALPTGGESGDVAFLVDLAVVAEESGWDGVFLEDYIVHHSGPATPTCDPWIALAAMATATELVRLGTEVTAVPRRRPWKLARETVSVDRLSGGRLTLGVGIGDPVQWEFGFFGEETDAKTRGQQLDEGLEILK